MTSNDRGKSESIALALELGADAILLDEKDGRHAARALGLRVVDVLLVGKAQGSIKEIHPLLHALRRTAGFYLDEGLCQYLFLVAGEANLSDQS